MEAAVEREMITTTEFVEFIEQKYLQKIEGANASNRRAIQSILPKSTKLPTVVPFAASADLEKQ